MATIDNLNFKVILDDVDFNKRIKDDIAAAKAANVELSTLLEVKQYIRRLPGKRFTLGEKHILFEIGQFI